ncbi:MAG: hypothetical protein WBG71_00050 [Leeuwenhoekiella sp.]
MKKLILYGGLAVAALSFFGKNKISGLGDAIGALQVKFKRFSNMNFKSGIRFDADVVLLNPTPVDIGLGVGNMVTLSKIVFKDVHGRVLGTSFPNITAIEIPARNGVELEGIPVQLDGDNINNIIKSLFGKGLNPESLKYDLVFTALGQEFTVNV